MADVALPRMDTIFIGEATRSGMLAEKTLSTLGGSRGVNRLWKTAGLFGIHRIRHSFSQAVKREVRQEEVPTSE